MLWVNDVNITFAVSDKYVKSEKVVTVTVETDVLLINLNEVSGDVGSEINVSVNITLNGNLIGSESISYLLYDEIRSLNLVNSEGTIDSSNKSFTIDLADYMDSLVVGENNISFHMYIGLLGTVFSNEDIFNNVTVNASEPGSVKIAVNKATKKIFCYFKR